MLTIKIATLNINGITSRAMVDMLENFLRVHDIDILFAQEVPAQKQRTSVDTRHTTALDLPCEAQQY
jgi:exonuclease III